MKCIGVGDQDLIGFHFLGRPFSHEFSKAHYPGLEITYFNFPVAVLYALNDFVGGKPASFLGEGFRSKYFFGRAGYSPVGLIGAIDYLGCYQKARVDLCDIAEHRGLECLLQ